MPRLGWSRRILTTAALLFSSVLLISRRTGFDSQTTISRVIQSTLSDELLQFDENRCVFRNPELSRTIPIIRAIVAYLSVAQLDIYLKQLKWCLRSLVEMMKTEPALWRTDMIIYVENVTVPDLLSLGCSTARRTSLSEPFKCILVEYTRLQHRTVDANSTDYHRNLVEQLKEYPYGESLIPLAENPSAYSTYDYVVRTDLDVFFTSAFSQWTPPGCAFIVGNGGYSHDYNMQKLAHVANYSGTFFNSSVWNIGSTWIGPAPLVAKIAERAVHWMVHLSKIEFSPKMRTTAWWGQASMWPEWHYGVLSMYGAHLAVNEVLHAGIKYPFMKIDLDHPTTSKANCTPEGPIHLHTYQSDEYFSKYAFTGKKYNDKYPLPNVLNSTRCCNYAAYIAFDSSKLSTVELLQKLKTAKVLQTV